MNCDAHPLLKRFHKPDPELHANARDKRTVIAIDPSDWDLSLNASMEDAEPYSNTCNGCVCSRCRRSSDADRSARKQRVNRWALCSSRSSASARPTQLAPRLPRLASVSAIHATALRASVIWMFAPECHPVRGNWRKKVTARRGTTYRENSHLEVPTSIYPY